MFGAARAGARAFRATMLAWMTLASLVVLLAGCGFHLQGSGALPETSRKVRIVASDEVTPFAVELRRAIERSGGSITDITAEADTVIRIRRDRSGRRVLSVSARNTPQEYEIFYAIEYSVERGGSEVLETQPLELVRTMSFEQSQLLAKDREEAILREAMARDLAMLVTRRLESL
jgi:LPS-assembly lipoprotein